eukprot:scaffold2181_cov214-Alexandrium_tamarense.AAC.1
MLMLSPVFGETIAASLPNGEGPGIVNTSIGASVTGLEVILSERIHTLLCAYPDALQQRANGNDSNVQYHDNAETIDSDRLGADTQITETVYRLLREEPTVLYYCLD